jgi:CheY-like chemotaxis protein
VLRNADEPLVVLLDNVLPEMTGVDILTLARGDERLARHMYIVWTASPHRIPHDLFATPDVVVLPKPFEIDTLLARVAEAAARLDPDVSA